MAYSYNEVTATGEPQLIAVPPYIDQAHIFVRVAGVETPDFSWVNDQTVSVTAPAGVPVRVYRRTSPHERVVDYMDGKDITEAVLDADSMQAFYLAQEQLDNTDDAVDAIGSLPDALAQMAQETEASRQNVLASEAARDAAEVSMVAAQAAQAGAEAAAAVAAGHEAATAASAATASAAASTAVAAATDPNVVAVGENIDTLVEVAAEIPNLATKVNKTSDTGAAAIPWGTTAQRPPTPQNGYTRFNTDLQALETFNAAASAWVPAGQGATGPVGNPVLYEADQVLNGPYTLQPGKNGFAPGPFTFGPSGSLTVPSGASFTIVD